MKFTIVLSFLSFLALALPFVTGNPLHGRHNEVARRARGEVDLHKRIFPSTRLTYYDVGLGACGIWNEPSDSIVALNVEQFGPGYPGKYCFKTISIEYNGIVITATITDKCMGCPWGGLDLSRGLFSRFASEAVGVLSANWWFEDDE